MSTIKNLLIFLTISLSITNTHPISVNRTLGATLAFSFPALLKASMTSLGFPSEQERKNFDQLESSLKPEDNLRVPGSKTTILKKDHTLMRSKVEEVLQLVEVKDPQLVRCYPVDVPMVPMAATGTPSKKVFFYSPNFINENQYLRIIKNEKNWLWRHTPQQKHQLRTLEGIIGHEGRHLTNNDPVTATLVAFGSPTLGIAANLLLKRKLPTIPTGIAYAALSWILTSLYMVKAEKRADLESCQLLGIDHTRSMAKFWKTMDKIEAANDINLADYPTLYKLLTMHPPHSERSAYLTTLAEKMETV